MHPHDAPCDLLLTGGRVIDPETGLDALRAVGIRDGAIVHVGDPDVQAHRTVTVSGLVVAPGFIDLHSHAQSINGLRLQALDGVTTALELEAGTMPVDAHYRWSAGEGRPVNFGYSAGWAYARMHVLDGVPLADPHHHPDFRSGEEMFTRYQALPGWRGPATPRQVDEILDLVHRELAQGAIGIGALLGYMPGSPPGEFSRLAALAAELDRTLFVHARYLSPHEPHSSLAGVRELIDLAREHGTRMHLCHMNSTSGLSIDAVADALEEARAEGLAITTEAYPYGTGSTAIGAEFLAPDRLAGNGLVPRSITYLVTGERIADEARLAEIRAEDPGGPCLVEFLDPENPEHRALLVRALTFPGGSIASDAGLPNHWGDEAERERAEEAIFGDVWPLPESLIAHPRSSGCYSRVLGWLVREQGEMSLMEAIRRSSLVPALLLEHAVPGMRRKGRIQPGADADLVVFNPVTVSAQGGYTSLEPAQGFEHVFVGGEAVVSESRLIETAFPGDGVRGVGV